MTRTVVLYSLAIIALVCLTSSAMAADTDDHTVTVTVSTINEIAIAGGNIELTIDTATAGSQPTNATDTTCDLNWTTNDVDIKKITVVTDLAAPVHTLKVVATGVSGGTAAAEVTLSDTPANFVTAIAETIGTCELDYTASATAAEGEADDVHTVTYTIVNA